MLLPYMFRTNKVVNLLEPHEPFVHKSPKKPMLLILSPFINNTTNYLVGSLLSITVESGPVFGVSLHIVYPGDEEEFVSEKSLILFFRHNAATAYATFALSMKISITHQRTLLERPYRGHQQHCEKEEKYEIPFYVRNREHGRNLVQPAGGKKIIQRPPTAIAMNL